MMYLNLACGAVRPQSEEWINVDSLRAILPEGTPERRQLDSEPNYRDYNILEPLPWGIHTFDGILISHFIEHVDCHQATNLMRACHAMLKPGGVLLISVPDATTFRKNWPEDTVENAERLYGEPIHLPDGELDFMGYAGFNRFHKTLLSEDVLWCYFVRAGFEDGHIRKYSGDVKDTVYQDQVWMMAKQLNRIPFSLIMGGTK